MLCWTPGTAMVGLVPWPDNGPVHTVHNALLGLYEYANSLPEDARRPMPANDGGVASDEYRHANVRKMADRAEDAGSGALFKNQSRRRDGQGPQVVCEVDETPCPYVVDGEF